MPDRSQRMWFPHSWVCICWGLLLHSQDWIFISPPCCKRVQSRGLFASSSYNITLNFKFRSDEFCLQNFDMSWYAVIDWVPSKHQLIDIPMQSCHWFSKLEREVIVCNIVITVCNNLLIKFMQCQKYVRIVNICNSYRLNEIITFYKIHLTSWQISRTR